MSHIEAMNFLERYLQDADFRTAITEAPTVEAKRKIIEEAGFEFDKKHLQAVCAEIKGEEQEAPLSDEALEKIAGGSWWKKAESATIGTLASAVGLGSAAGGAAAGASAGSAAADSSSATAEETYIAVQAALEAGGLL